MKPLKGFLPSYLSGCPYYSYISQLSLLWIRENFIYLPSGFISDYEQIWDTTLLYFLFYKLPVSVFFSYLKLSFIL